MAQATVVFYLTMLDTDDAEALTADMVVNLMLGENDELRALGGKVVNRQVLPALPPESPYAIWLQMPNQLIHMTPEIFEKKPHHLTRLIAELDKIGIRAEKYASMDSNEFLSTSEKR